MDIKDILLFIVSLITAYLSLFIIRGKKGFSSIVFALFILSVGFWAFGISFFDISTTYNGSLFFAKFYYIAAAAIPLFFLLFTLSYPKERKVSLVQQVLTIAPFILIATAIIFLPNFIIKSIELSTPKSITLEFGSYLWYAIYFITLLLIAYFHLIRSYFKFKNEPETAPQLKFMIIGTLIPFLFGMLFNLILPIITYSLVWIGPLFGLAVVIVVMYSVSKFHLFNAKMVAAELFTFTLWLFILIRALISIDIYEKLTNIGLLVLTVVIGLFLIKSVKKEIETREKIESLAKELEQTNIRLKELDQQKSEFVSLASHQLRGPLTAVKGYASMLLDGDFGSIDPGPRDAMEKIYKSTQDLVVLVGDYLDVSRIEQGRMQYDFTTFDLRELTETVVGELRPTIERANINLDFDCDKIGEYLVNADKGKIKQVINNLLDNSIKYTPKGGVHVWLSHNAAGKLLISISDTGVGIHPDVLPRLFEKFTRAPDASKTNIMGTGLGLFVARKMIEAHNGRIWAESPGPNKGSTFFIELNQVSAESTAQNLAMSQGAENPMTANEPTNA